MGHVEGHTKYTSINTSILFCVLLSEMSLLTHCNWADKWELVTAASLQTGQGRQLPICIRIINDFV